MGRHYYHLPLLSTCATAALLPIRPPTQPTYDPSILSPSNALCTTIRSWEHPDEDNGDSDSKPYSTMNSQDCSKDKLWAFCISTKSWTLLACWDLSMLPIALKWDFEIWNWWMEVRSHIPANMWLMDLITQSQGKQQLWSNQVSPAIVDISAIYNYRKCSMISFMLRISRRNFNCNKDKSVLII